MFCFKCGEKVLDNARFCHVCGQKLDMINTLCGTIDDTVHIDNTNLDESSKKDVKNTVLQMPKGKAIGFNILDYSVRISDEDASRKELREYFQKYAAKNVDRVRDYIAGNVKCLDDVYIREIPFITNCIKEALENAVEIAQKLGIIDMDYEWLAALMDDSMNLESYFEYYYQIAESLRRQASQMESYRNLQHQKNGYWIGGGFGIWNAIKGHIEATALNIGTCIIKDITNSVSASRDQAKIIKAKELIYYDRNLRENLLMITYYCSFMPYYALQQIFEEANEHLRNKEVEINRVDGRNVFDEYLREEIDFEKAVAGLIKAVQYEPFEIKNYIYIELLSKEAKEYIENALFMLNIEQEYKYEVRATEEMLFEEVGKISDTSIVDIRSKLRLLELLQNYSLNISEAEKKNRNKRIKEIWSRLMRAWKDAVSILPEYELEEIEKKIQECADVKDEYDKKNEYLSKEWDEQLKRLNSKKADKRLLSCADIQISEVQENVKRIKGYIEEKNFDDLWKEAEKQNGLAQTALLEFYLRNVGKQYGKVCDKKKIKNTFTYLGKKLAEKNLFAEFIEISMIQKIELYNCNTNDSAMKRKINIEFLNKLNKAHKENIIYACYRMADEVYFQGAYWKYLSYGQSLPTISYETAVDYLQKSANALIPDAIKSLIERFENKGTGSFDKERNAQSVNKLKCIVKELNLLDILEMMECKYELYRFYKDTEKTDNLEEIIICSNCGYPIKAGKKFCTQCGTRALK